MKFITQYQSWSKLSLIFVSLFAVIVVSSSCSPTSTPTQSPTPEYTEKQFTVLTDKVYRLDIFANEGDSITGYWKSSDSLQYWYTDSYGLPRLMLTEEPSVSPTGERIGRLHEPGEGFRLLEMWHATFLDREAWFEIKNAKGDIVDFETLSGARAHNVQVEADRTGYYSLCFYIYDDDVKSVDVTIRYQVK